MLTRRRFVMVTAGAGAAFLSSAILKRNIINADSPQITTSQTPFFEETGLHSFSYTIPKTGTYTLGVGVSDAGDTTRTSGLLIDNVKLTSTQ